MRGLSVDVVDEVCNHAKKSCQHIVVPIEYCWNNEDLIGSGKVTVRDRCKYIIHNLNPTLFFYLVVFMKTEKCFKLCT